MLLKKERVREDKKTRSRLSLFALFAFGLPPPPPSGLSLSLPLPLFLACCRKEEEPLSLRFLSLSFSTMHAVAAAEATTTIGGLELGGAKAAVPENKRGASKIASLRAAADLDGAADGGEEPCPASTSSSSHPADPTLETCCHEPPPIALNPLNSWLFFGEKALRLPIPPTNDIVVSLLIFGLSVFFRSVRAPRGKKTNASRLAGGGFPQRFDSPVPLEPAWTTLRQRWRAPLHANRRDLHWTSAREKTRNGVRRSLSARSGLECLDSVARQGPLCIRGAPRLEP